MLHLYDSGLPASSPSTRSPRKGSASTCVWRHRAGLPASATCAPPYSFIYADPLAAPRQLPGHHVRNVTDIDDKILNKSAEAAGAGERGPTASSANSPRRTGPRHVEAPHVRAARHRPHPRPNRSRQRLIDAGHAPSDGRGSVYFDVHSQPDYGSLTRQRLVDMRTAEDDAQIRQAVEPASATPALRPLEGQLAV